MSTKTSIRQCHCGSPARGEGEYAYVCTQWPLCETAPTPVCERCAAPLDTDDDPPSVDCHGLHCAVGDCVTECDRCIGELRRDHDEQKAEDRAREAWT